MTNMEFIKALAATLDEEEKGSHRHRCDSCGLVWEHGNNCQELSRDIFEQSHACTRCGRRVVQKYRGDLPTERREVCAASGITVEVLHG